MSRSLLIVFAFSLSSLADTNPVKRLYPVFPLAAGLGCKHIFSQATGLPAKTLDSFCDKLVLASMFATGDEVKGALIEHELVNSTRAAHLAAASSLLVMGVDHAHNPVSLAQYARASACNQLGGFARENVKDVPDDLKTSSKVLLALNMMFPFLLENNQIAPTTFFGKLGASQSFATAYMLREAMLEAVKNLKLEMPELIVAAVMTAAGATGMAMYTAFTIPYFVYLAILDAGAFTFADESVKAAQTMGLNAWAARVLAAGVGAIGYAKSAQNSAAQSVSTTFFYPLAFSLTYEAAQQLWSRAVDESQKLVKSESDL